MDAGRIENEKLKTISSSIGNIEQKIIAVVEFRRRGRGNRMSCCCRINVVASTSMTSGRIEA